ncbi:hypothetical protein HPB47_025077 [Ixodes persulcatus]|uniref:Uncharacterized protein n=1 Tax=Ixodes persulcatus TaxID=34615 RepID=A0AC60Q2H6_IXOPE|nr:hypothetical protein HPB47_025077 [Ixodes persulcatus]
MSNDGRGACLKRRRRLRIRLRLVDSTTTTSAARMMDCSRTGAHTIAGLVYAVRRFIAEQPRRRYLLL